MGELESDLTGSTRGSARIAASLATPLAPAPTVFKSGELFSSPLGFSWFVVLYSIVQLRIYNELCCYMRSHVRIPCESLVMDVITQRRV